MAICRIDGVGSTDMMGDRKTTEAVDQVSQVQGSDSLPKRDGSDDEKKGPHARGDLKAGTEVVSGIGGGRKNI